MITYSTVNEKGDVGVTGVSYPVAEQDLEYMQENYPDEDWIIIEDDEWEDWEWI